MFLLGGIKEAELLMVFVIALRKSQPTLVAPSIIAIDPHASTHGVKVSNDNNNLSAPEGIPRTVQFHNINFLL